MEGPLLLHPDHPFSDSEDDISDNNELPDLNSSDIKQQNNLRSPPPIENGIYFKKVYPQARAPTRGSLGSAGYDLYSISDTFIPCMDIAKIQTGISIKIPDDCYGRLAPRSGLSVVHRLHILGGVIDPDYQGPICCVLQNLHPQNDVFLPASTRIAQIIFEKKYSPALMIEVADFSCLPTQRALSGFGEASGLY